MISHEHAYLLARKAKIKVEIKGNGYITLHKGSKILAKTHLKKRALAEDERLVYDATEYAFMGVEGLQSVSRALLEVNPRASLISPFTLICTRIRTGFGKKLSGAELDVLRDISLNGFENTRFTRNRPIIICKESLPDIMPYLKTGQALELLHPSPKYHDNDPGFIAYTDATQTIKG